MGSVQHPTLGDTRLTYRDYLELPDDGRRYEILDGELAVTPAPTTRHQHASAELLRRLLNHVRENDLGHVFHAPIDVLLADDCILQPDLVFVSKKREGIIELRAIEGPPDFVLEILSQSTERRDRTTKANLYARFGIPHYWLVDPEARTLETYEKGKRRYRRTARFEHDEVVDAQPFPGLQLALAELWM